MQILGSPLTNNSGHVTTTSAIVNEVGDRTTGALSPSPQNNSELQQQQQQQVKISNL
jgi:hypothetical protein